MDGQVRYAKSGEVHLAYKVLGDGPLDVLFVLPWFSNLDLLDDYPASRNGIERLASFARVILLDRRGTGLSDRMCGTASLEEGMDDLIAVLDEAQCERVAVMGMNESGTLCALTAATHPSRISGLILYGSFAATVRQPDYPWAPSAEERQQQVDFLVETWGMEGIAGLINPSAAGDDRFVKWAARWMRGSMSKDALPRAYEILSVTDVRHVLPSIRVPTLVLHRTDDLVVPVENGRYLAERIPGAKFVEMPGDNHLPFLGDWESILDEVEEFLTGARRAREPERVLATILFADIVDSSKKASELGDHRWAELLDRHEEIVREELRRLNGRLVKTMGDGVLAIFDGPARAIRCACRLSERARSLGVETRFGIHTGEVDKHGDDLVGIAVHIGARVASLARAGEVLVSSAVPPLVAGSGIDFEDRGVHALRGIDGEWRIYRAKP